MMSEIFNKSQKINKAINFEVNNFSYFITEGLTHKALKIFFYKPLFFNLKSS